MVEFENLKRSYISAIQWGLVARVEYKEFKRVNESIHKLFENLIDNSNYNSSDKAMMKCELNIIKEALCKEIESFYQKG